MSDRAMAEMSQEYQQIIREAGFELTPQPLCDEFDIEMYEPSQTIERVLRIDGACGKMHVLLDESGESSFNAGVVFFPEALRESEYERFALWFSKRITLSGTEDDDTVVERFAEVEDPDFSRYVIRSKLWGSDDPLNWGVYDVGVARRDGGTIIQFTYVPYIALEQNRHLLHDQDQEWSALLVRALAEYWFEENRALSLERP